MRVPPVLYFLHSRQIFASTLRVQSVGSVYEQKSLLRLLYTIAPRYEMALTFRIAWKQPREKLAEINFRLGLQSWSRPTSLSPSGSRLFDLRLNRQFNHHNAWMEKLLFFS